MLNIATEEIQHLKNQFLTLEVQFYNEVWMFIMRAYLNYKTLLLNINFKGVFGTQTNLYGATFLLTFNFLLQLGSKYASEFSFVLFAFSGYFRMISLFSTLRKVFFIIVNAIQANLQFLVRR